MTTMRAPAAWRRRLAPLRRPQPIGTAEGLIDRIRTSVIGDDAVIEGPFGPRRMVYADATASGRSLGFVEDFIREQVLPMYGNTHTEASATGRRTTELREQARAVIHQAVNGGPDDVVVFCGAGATGAIDKLIRMLELQRGQRPVVFIGPYEHHSNELPWRESVADVVTIREDEEGRVDIEHLEHELRRHADRRVKIGSFSAASNVTGIVTDVDEVAIALHRYGAQSCWDYAAAGPYLPTRADAHERLAGWLVDLGDMVPDASARIGTQLERAHHAASELRAPAARLEALAHGAARRLAEAADKVHRRGDLPSEIAFLERALALLAPGDRARAELLPAMGVALFEASSLDRAQSVADEAVAAGLDRVRLRGEVERERMRAYRHPDSVDPAASLVVAEAAAVALEALGDDVGVARARYLMCELAWLQGASERGLREAREALRFARRAGATVEIDAGVSVIAWALVVNQVPVAAARAECDELLRSVSGRRFAELGVRGFVAVLDAMAGDFETALEQLARSRDGLNDLGLHQASIWMAVFDAQSHLLAGDPVRAEAALADAERVAREIGDRWFLSTILVDRAHVLLAQDRPSDAAAAVAGIEEVPAPKDLEWRIKRLAARGKLAAREGHAEQALTQARAAVALADPTEMFLFRADAWRDLAEVTHRCGEAEEAAAARATALRLYRAKGNVAAARQLARFRRRGRQAEAVDG